MSAATTLEEKRALLKRLLAKAPAPAGIRHDAAGRYAPFPLTEMQRAYVLGREAGFADGGTSCHLYLETALPAARLDAVEAAWNRLVQCHDMLRARIHADHTQVLAEVPFYAFAREDLRSLPPEEAEQASLATRDRMRNQILPLGTWPLFEIRASLLPDGSARLHIDVDLLICDAAGLMRLLLDWSRLSLEEGAPLTVPGIGFRDLVLAETPPLEADLAWWRAALPDLPPGPDLPRGSGGAVTFTRTETALPPGDWARLRTLAQAQGLTPSALLLAAYAEALGNYSQSRRFTLTITRFERDARHPDAALVVGESTVTSLIALDLRAASFLERARAVATALEEALAHGTVNGVTLLREARPPLAFPCVFTSLVGQTAGRLSLRAIEAGLGERRFSVSATPQVWVDHQVFEDEGGLRAFWDVRDGALAEGVMAEIAAGWQALLQALASSEPRWTEPVFRRRSAADLDLHTKVNEAFAPIPEGPLHGPWLAAAVQYADRPAVIAPDRTLTHGDLLAESGRVAAALRALGAGPEDRVAIHCPKGWRQIVAALGVVRAGAAYLPIEASLPAARVAAILDRSAPVAALTVGAVPPVEGWPAHIPRLDLDALPVAPFVDGPVDPSSLAYVIFTSGSTGAPKGVMIEHRAALNTVLDLNARCGIGPDDRVLGLSALGFDLSVWDLFGVLGAGGALVLPEAGSDPATWVDAIVSGGVTVWNTVPALAEMLVEHAEGSWGLPGGLRLFLLSGDWIPVELPKRLRAAAAPNLRIWSLGGATEASIWSIAYEIGEVDPRWSSIPYGFPLTNQRWRVLDERGEDCPTGVPGELWIGGVGVARGYLGDPERSAERFSVNNGYRTGDFGRYRADGSLEFLGRQDAQVKVRGHRIELGEIESTLLRHPRVSAAVAYAPSTGTGRHRHLLAAVVPLSLRAGSEEVPPSGWTEALAAAVSWRPDPEEAALVAVLGPAFEGLNADSAAMTARALVQLGIGEGETPLHPLLPEGEGAPAGADEGEKWSTERPSPGPWPGRAGHPLPGGEGESQGHPQISVDLAIARGVLPAFRRWLERAFLVLEEAGLARREGDLLHLTPPPPEPAPRHTGDPRLDRMAEISHRAGLLLPEVLTGKRPATDLLFIEGSSDAAEQVYGLSFTSANRLLAAALHGWLDALPADASVHALEVGAGIGSTTRYLLPLLPPERSAYVYTDISPWFFDEARARFAEFPFLQFARWDLESDPEPGTLPFARYDLLVASSVVHAARSVDQALARLRALLRPGGLLLMVEETTWHPSFNLTMGLQTGFDSAADGRGPHPLLTAETWREALGRAGFVASEALMREGTASQLMGISALVAVASKAEPVSAADLKAALARALPAYMVPSEVYLLDALPLSANGKVDRAALPVPGSRKGARLLPAQGAETLVAGVWSRVLGRADLSSDDHFFEIGGDSLQVISVKRALSEALGRDVPVAVLFEHPTIAALARWIDREAAPSPVPAPAPADGADRAAAATAARHRRRGA